MTTMIARIATLPMIAWKRFFDYLETRNQEAVNAWGASLQYKRRYTNPEDAKLCRRAQ